MTTKPNSIEAKDVAYHLHANSSPRDLERFGPLVIDKGEGVYVYDLQGNKYIESMAGLWSAALGFSEKRLADAVYKQMNKLPFYHTFTLKANEPSVDLAEKLLALAPEQMSKVHFTNSGSEANDSVVKLLWFYFNSIGKPSKKKFIARNKAYHGVTVASGSLTGLGTHHLKFDLPLDFVIRITEPDYTNQAVENESEAEFCNRMIQELKQSIAEHGAENIAAFIGEPVMAAGGVIVPPENYWPQVEKVCRENDILIVSDEVVTGFARTGKMWGCEQYGFNPDIMVLSKQLTSSYLPMAAILFTDSLYQVIADGAEEAGILGAGFTTAAHPVVSALALENIRIMQEDKLLSKASELEAHFLDRVHSLSKFDFVHATRGVGLIGAAQVATSGKVGATGKALSKLCHSKGLIPRNIGDNIAFCPPLIINDAQIDEVFDKAESAFAEYKG